MKDYVYGTQGKVDVMAHSITGRTPWRYPPAQARRDNMYQAEHDAFFRSIRSGTPINNGEYMAKSSLMAIQARMAAYTGQQIPWEAALNSKEDLSPPKYDWDVALAPPAIAMPGQTKFF